ncbi:hypothetical protein BRADI_2g19610v3 [Brachypodium distachyon]|uniref:Uncharacterized protein n=1 Tax=Brachypodium distachyon TaxID=15368 RepID=A0A2K2D9G2_BRADI|nr:hypothetical protein BRADI_2g19610v3 [Brachypodium distachyon]PNT70907.1 hypothetical protein BRADI_2g19610v3 [Brachypodium distachyon]
MDMNKGTGSGCAEDNVETGNYANSSQNPETLDNQSLPYTSQSLENNTGQRKNYKRTANRGRKGYRVLADRNYPLRSSDCDTTVRVLRSRSAANKPPSDSAHTLVHSAANKFPSDSVHTLVQPAAKRIKRGRPTKKGPNNEFSKIRQRVRYILNRMNYEQSLLEAYANEGWKRQSLEKIRPEKELERAKEEIVRCKLRIREAFQNLDSLLSMGKLDESLFDNEGKISCEDIICATCSSQYVTLNNDIILCDGVCDRGFHQKCLNPPLLTKDIPAGDEGWLCPACDCKIDCIDVINELQGTNLSISDSWEKVFPETAALAHGTIPKDAFDLPSEDSEDSDFDPNIAEEHVTGHEEGSSEEDEDEGSDSDDSNFVTTCDNSEHLKEKEKVDDLGLPSEDSEDDDYDPAGPDSDKDIKEKQDESDFTSDSDDFCAEIAKSCGRDEVSSGAKDAYGEAPSDSSDGEEWSGKSTSEKGDEERNEVDSFLRKSSRGTGTVQQSNDFLPQSARQSLDPDGLVNGQHPGKLTSDVSNNKTNRKPLNNKEEVDDLGLPSEDSEDDDYDPAGPDSDKDIEKKQSSSNESDYSSASDDFCGEIAKSCGREGVPSGAKAVSGRRQDQSLDCKKLYDEACREASSDSSDGEDWSGKCTPEKDSEKQSDTCRRTGAVRQSNGSTPDNARQSLHRTNGQHTEELLTSDGSSSTVHRRQFGPIIYQRLHEHFKTDQYPKRAVKESLANELGLTFQQVSKWFETRRYKTRIAAKKNDSCVKNHSIKENQSSVAAHIEATDPKDLGKKLNVCKNGAANDVMASGILNGGIKQDSPLKQDTSGGLGTHVSPPGSSPKGDPIENHGNNTSSRCVGKPKDGYTGNVVLALPVVDDRTKEAAMRELKKRKTGS